MFWFIVVLLIAGAGFYFYQKLMNIEREIRAEQEAGKAGSAAPQPSAAGKTEPEPVREEEATGPPVVTPEVEKMAAKATPVPDEGMTTEEEIVVAVTNLPGIKQTELYTSFPDIDKKKLQQMIKELADSGKLKREKQGSSYLLHPA